MMRERRKWTDEEDALLRKAVTRGPLPSQQLQAPTDYWDTDSIR